MPASGASPRAARSAATSCAASAWRIHDVSSSSTSTKKPRARRAVDARGVGLDREEALVAMVAVVVAPGGDLAQHDVVAEPGTDHPRPGAGERLVGGLQATERRALDDLNDEQR